jgi:hypothetical protein
MAVVFIPVNMSDGLVHLGRFSEGGPWPQYCEDNGYYVVCACGYNTITGYMDHKSTKDWSLAKTAVTCLMCLVSAPQNPQ